MVEGSTVYFTCLLTRCNIKFAIVTLVGTRASDLCTYMISNYIVQSYLMQLGDRNELRKFWGVKCLFFKIILVIETCFKFLNSCSCQGRKADNNNKNRGRCSQPC